MTGAPNDELTEKAVGRGALATSATAVLACAVCCGLPLLLPALALGAGGAMLPWLAGAHAWLRVITLLAVAAAWAWVVVERVVRRRRLRRSTWLMLGMSTVMAAATLVWQGLGPVMTHGHH